MSTVIQMKVSGKSSGSSLNIPLKALGDVSIANAFRNLGQWIESIAVGSRTFNGVVWSGGVQASGTLTLSSFVANDTVTINGVVFTGKASPASNVEFLIGADDTATAVNLAAKLNSTSAPNKILNVISATSALGVVTITMLESGQIGNLGTLAISAHGSRSGANLTGGTDGTMVSLAKGI